MGRIVRWVFGLGLAVLLLVGGLVNLLGSSGPARPDPSTLISLPDGGQVRLDTLLSRAEGAEGDAVPEVVEEVPTDGGLVESAGGLPEGDLQDPHELAMDLVRRSSWRENPDPGDPYELGEYHLWTTGETDQAYALFQSVPADHPHYNVAQRRIGWEILTKERGDPRQGVAYINRSMRADPFDHDIWQDTWRVYMRTLGMEVP
jgi:hypothetical protein